MSRITNDDMRSPLILTKLKAPTDFGHLLLRPRLIKQLTDGIDYRVTLIHGSAGFGKTSLASQWHDYLVGQGASVAWLSLDTEDNDAERCIKHIIEAIRLATPSITVDTIALSESKSEQTIKYIFTELINKIQRFDAAVYLVLDDWHLIQNPKLHQALTFLIEHAPDHFHLLICSRSLPDLPLATLRVKNQLLEIDGSDLRFDESESAAFLQELNHLELKPKIIRTLWQKTEGWVASLQLVLLVLRADNSHKGLSNLTANLDNNHSIGEYLAENVLDNLPKHTLDFLLQTALLDRLNGDLCNAVTGRTDSQKQLESLYQQGLFIRPLDQEQQWFQYHHLFASFLQRRLKRHQAEKIPALHLAASHWFAAQGQTDEAVRHALAAHADELAITLVEQNAMWLVEHSFMGTLLSLVDKLPKEKIKRRCELQLAIAWAHCLTHHQQAAQEALDCVARALVREDHPNEKAIRAEARVVEACIDIYADRLDGVEALLRPCFKEPQAYSPWILAVAHNILTYVLIHTYRYEEAIHLQHQAQRYHQKTQGPFSGVYGDCFAGIAALATCQLTVAADYFTQALNQAIEQAGQHSHAAYLSGALLGQLLYERNQLDEAEKLLENSRKLGLEGGVADFYIATYIFSGRLKILKKQWGDAHTVFNEGKQAAIKLQIPRLQFTLKSELIKLYLREGNVKTAKRLMAYWEQTHVITPSATPGIAEQMLDIRERAKARLSRGDGSYQQTIEMLSAILQETIKNSRRYAEVRVRTVLAGAMNKAKQYDQAEATLLPALLVGFEQGIIRTFLDEGTAITPVIQRLCERERHHQLPDNVPLNFGRWLINLLAADKAQQSLVNDKDKTSETQKQQTPPLTAEAIQNTQDLIEPLKPREIEILKLLDTGLANKEIARELNIGVNTVKWYLKSIYTKLGVNRRAQAVSEARHLKLLE